MPALPAKSFARLLVIWLPFLLSTLALDPVPDKCNQYSSLYESIERDLAIYKQNGGITPNLLYRTMTLHSAAYREKGLAVAFYHGKAYVISHSRNMDLSRFGHHVALWVSYLRVLLDLEAKHGAMLPNVEFVFHTIDRPMRLTNTTPGADDNYPVFRFCKSAANPDILIPNFHFYMKHYQSQYLDTMSDLADDRPWETRGRKVFARFTLYSRHVIPGDPNTQRLDVDGKPLCKVQSAPTAICPVRGYLEEWAAKYPDTLDIKSGKAVPMKQHAAYRYLLHVDGQGLSSKLETLLTLGSLVMKEESGYMAFYHHLLKPYEHYVPVWKRGSGPQDILEALEWARSHDAEAHAIATAGQALAARYLSAEARECFWLTLLRSYAETLTYDPVAFRNITVGKDGEATGRWRYLKPVQRFLDEEVTMYFPEVVQKTEWEA